MMAIRGRATNTSEQGQKAANPEKGTPQSFPPTLNPLPHNNYKLEKAWRKFFHADNLIWRLHDLLTSSAKTASLYAHYYSF